MGEGRIEMSKEKKYISESGNTCTAYQYKKGLEFGICKKHNKPYILQTDGDKLYLSEGD